MLLTRRSSAAFAIFGCVIALVVIGPRRCLASDERLLSVEERARTMGTEALARQLTGYGAAITNSQYRDLMTLHSTLCRRTDARHPSCRTLEIAIENYRNLQNQLLDQGWRIGIKLAARPRNRAHYLAFKATCTKLDVFRTGSADEMHSLPHLMEFDRFRQQILAKCHRRRSTIWSFFKSLLSCFRTPKIESDQPTADIVESHAQREPYTPALSYLQPASEVGEDGLLRHSEIRSVDGDDQNQDDNDHATSEGQRNVMLIVNLVDQEPILLLLMVPHLDNNYRELLSILVSRIISELDNVRLRPSDSTNEQPQRPFPANLPALNLPGYSDETCERFLQQLNRFESALNADLYKMQTFAKQAGLLAPSQIKQWRGLYENFLHKLNLLGIDTGLFLQIIAVLKKQQKTQDDRRVETVLANHIRYAFKYVEEIARMERSMEARRRLPNCWQTYCDMCMTPFPSGDELTPMQLLHFRTSVRMKGNEALSMAEINRQIEALEEPDTREESPKRKEPVLLSALEESELLQGQDEVMLREIVFCALCGYRCCRACIERAGRTSACRCPVCSQTLMVPTVRTLRTLRTLMSSYTS